MTEEIPVDVSSAAATLQSAMNAFLREIADEDPQELTGDELLRIAQVQALIDIANKTGPQQYVMPPVYGGPAR